MSDEMRERVARSLPLVSVEAWGVMREASRDYWRRRADAALAVIDPDDLKRQIVTEFDIATGYMNERDALRAEVGRLREAAHVGAELDNHHNAAFCPYCTGGVVDERDAALRYLAALREGVEALVGKYSVYEFDGTAELAELHVLDALRALLAQDGAE